MATVAVLAENLSKLKITGRSFAGEDLKGRDMSFSVFENCNFDGADMTGANCEGAFFPGSTFRGTICTYTNFKDARLGGAIWDPKDAYGCVLTMSCDTFRATRMGQFPWFLFLMFATQMELLPGPVSGNPKDALIAAIGAERYVKLSKLLARREI